MAEQGELFNSEETFQQAVAEPQPEPQAEAPVEAVPEAPPAPEPTPPAEIPSWRLREEAEARRMAEDRARQLEARLQQIEAHQRQVQAGQKQPDFFENPLAATQQIVMQMVQPLAVEYRQQAMELGKAIASVRHGEDKVSEAENAFMEARAAGTLDQADYERVVGSRNRYDAVVGWHKRQAVLSSVGDDPSAWFEKQLEARMAEPEFQAKLLERVRGSAATRPSVTKLPPSLSKATAAAGNLADEGDLSHDSLFAYANKR